MMIEQEKDSDIADRINDAAAVWAARRLSGNFGASEKRAFQDWLAADPRHEVAIKEYLDIAETSALAGKISGVSSAANDEKKATDRRAWLVAVPALAASLFAAFFFFGITSQPPDEIKNLATMRGETHEAALSDGSVVTLNTNTQLTVLIDENSRKATLTRGEAFFDVAHDETKPFIVSGGAADVQVLGTSFTVQATPDGDSIVRVHSGVVSVQPNLSDDAAPIRLDASQAVVVRNSGSVGAISSFSPSEDATWRLGYLEFEKTPLHDVVADLNRYFEPQIELDDHTIGDTPVTGRFDLSDQAVAVRALSIALSLEVDQQDPSAIILKAYD